MEASIAQQIVDARDLAACGQPTCALVYYEALIPHLSKWVAQQLTGAASCSTRCLTSVCVALSVVTAS